MNWNPNGAETWVPVIMGAGVIVYSLITNYEWGMIGILSMPLLLAMDVVGGVLLAASPWLFGFSERVWMPHLILGVAEIDAGMMTQTVPTKNLRETGSRSATR